MAQKPETRFRKRVVDKLKLLPNLWVESIQQQTIVGTPDLLMCCQGRFIAWELKTDENDSEPSIMQRHKITAINRSGGYAVVVRPSNFKEEFEKLRKIAYGES